MQEKCFGEKFWEKNYEGKTFMGKNWEGKMYLKKSARIFKGKMLWGKSSAGF